MSKKEKWSKKKKIIISVLSIVVILIGTGVGIFLYILSDLNTQDINESNINVTPDEDIQNVVSNDKSVSNITNIALFGIDNTDGEWTGRCDCTVVLSLDTVHNKIKMISLARDTFCPIEGRKYKEKLTHAYIYGGPELAINTINSNYNLNIKDYATVNFNNMKKIIDECSGIDIQLTKGELNYLNYEMNANVKVDDNMVAHLNGEQTLNYTRIRYIDTDQMRNHRQQNVLEKLFEKIASQSAVQMATTIQTLLPYVKTSYNYYDIAANIPFIISKPTIEHRFIPCEALHPDEGYFDVEYTSVTTWLTIYDLKEAGKMINQYIYDDIDFEKE